MDVGWLGCCHHKAAECTGTRNGHGLARVTAGLRRLYQTWSETPLNFWAVWTETFLDYLFVCLSGVFTIN